VNEFNLDTFAHFSANDLLSHLPIAAIVDDAERQVRHTLRRDALDSALEKQRSIALLKMIVTPGSTPGGRFDQSAAAIRRNGAVDPGKLNSAATFSTRHPSHATASDITISDNARNSKRVAAKSPQRRTVASGFRPVTVSRRGKDACMTLAASGIAERRDRASPNFASRSWALACCGGRTYGRTSSG